MARTQLHAVQTQRAMLRDIERQKLARLLTEEKKLNDQISRFANDRDTQLAELADLFAERRVDVRAAAKRRYYSSQIDRELIMLNAAKEQLSLEVDEQRRALAAADAAVKAVENLIEKREEEARVAAIRRDQLRIEDEWAAGKAAR